MKQTLLALFALLAGLITFQARAATVSEQQVLALFFERNLDLISAHYQIDRAEAQELIAAAIPNPVLTVGSNELAGDFNVRPNGVGGRGMGFNVSISQLLEINGKRELRMESSRLGREAFESDFRDSMRILANTVRRTYYGLLLAQKTREIADGNARRYGEIVRANRLRLDAGDIAESDLMRVEVESYKARAEQDNATAALAKTRAELARLLAWPDEAMNLVAEDKWPEGTSAFLSQTESTVLDKAMESRPDLKSRQIRTAQAEKELELARRLIIPDVTVTAGYIQDAGNIYLDSGTVNISAPIPVFNQFKGDAGKAAVNLNDARLDLEQTRNSIRNEVVTAFAALASADAIVTRFEKEVLQRLEKVRTGAEFAYAQGATNLLTLIDAEQNYKTMMLDYYTALDNRTNAYADLLRAVGEQEAR